ncbi:PREDICTED: dynactin subunit 3 isoform X2 [Cercocebus atys]|uniref:dynactin subunit 3 isoform X2 n=1 Tax=Cercocebus atys TaxID=9531 RepID=UPI0005F4BA30|nr:PREDICTED: dynactin subunit 3 isoform X2 [Cercocebus atys]
MAGLTDVQRLQARVEELERWVYGPGGARGSRKVADGLVKVQVALGNIASKRERVKILYKKIEDLIKYLDPEYIDRIAIPDASKLQFILAEEQFILSQVALLEQVNALVPMLDSAHIKAVPEHAARLQHLAQIHIQQQAPFCAALWPYRTSVWRSLRSPRLSWRNTTRLQCFYPSNLCSGMSYFAS